MMTSSQDSSILAKELRSQLLDTLAIGVAALPDPIGNRPVFVLGPNSFLGNIYAGGVIASLARAVAVVDDVSTSHELYGLPRWSSYKFSSEVHRFPDAIGLDFSVGGFASALFTTICANSNIEHRDFVAALGEFEFPAVYEPVATMREKTIASIDRFLALERRLADDLSRTTLYAALLLRLTWNRRWLRNVLLSAEDEYFTQTASGSTFHLGDNETFCDAGAHVGLITSKFLSATRFRYDGIWAFEPDTANYKALRRMCLLPLKNFHVRNRALSDRTESLAFVETGTMGSHVALGGSGTTQATSLDEQMEKLTFLKMDVEGYETRVLRGAKRLIRESRPRMAVTAYHYANDLPDIIATLDEVQEGYHIRLRHHFNYFYDTIVYASPENGWQPPANSLR